MDVKGDEEMGPIDYLLVEWPGRLPDGEVAPYLIDLVESRLLEDEDEAPAKAPPAAVPPAAGGASLLEQLRE
jgi:hypothetical protein